MTDQTIKPEDELIKKANEALSEIHSDIRTIVELADEIRYLCTHAGAEFFLGISAIISGANEASQDKYLHTVTNSTDQFKLEMVKIAINQIKKVGLLDQLLPIILGRLESELGDTSDATDENQ